MARRMHRNGGEKKEDKEGKNEMEKEKGKKNQGNPDNATKSYARILLPSVHLKKAPGIYPTVS